MNSELLTHIETNIYKSQKKQTKIADFFVRRKIIMTEFTVNPFLKTF